MKRQHITELKLNKIKNPCLKCLYLNNKINKYPCLNCNKNNGKENNYQEI